MLKPRLPPYDVESTVEHSGVAVHPAVFHDLVVIEEADVVAVLIRGIVPHLVQRIASFDHALVDDVARQRNVLLLAVEIVEIRWCLVG